MLVVGSILDFELLEQKLKLCRGQSEITGIIV
jgi:hypothetical protein